MVIPDSLSEDEELHLLVAETPIMRLEDFIGCHHSLPLDDVVDFSSSSMTAVPISVGYGDIEDSSSATRNNFLCLAGHSADSGVVLSHLQQQPAAVDSMMVPSGSVVCRQRTSVVRRQRTSVYRGVALHKPTGLFKVHFWDKTWENKGRKCKGRKVYLGRYDNEERAARAHDLAALKFWGLAAIINFPVKNYCKEMEEMQNMTKPEFIASLRRKSSRISRGASMYTGVSRHHKPDRWQARIRVAGDKDFHLGIFATEEEAAEAYDVAAIKLRGSNAVINFDTSRYNMEAITNYELPFGADAKKMKLALQACIKTQLTIRSSAASLPSSSCEGPSAILQSSSHLPAPLHYDSFVGSEYADLCNQSLYCLSPNIETSHQINNGEIVQLMRAASSSQ